MVQPHHMEQMAGIYLVKHPLLCILKVITKAHPYMTHFNSILQFIQSG
jgi:hypothetical protein